jgi:hypothetical protein
VTCVYQQGAKRSVMSFIFAGLIFGVMGIYVFREGKRRLDYPLIFVGLALMFYPYLTSGEWATWGVGIGLSALTYYLIRR